MEHIFCQKPELNRNRWIKIMVAYEKSPSKVLELINRCILNCKVCFRYYIKIEKPFDFEKSLILNNFKTEKIYNWNLLFDKDILKAFCSNEVSEFVIEDFKVMFLIIFTNKINCNNSKLLKSTNFTLDEAKFFLNPTLPLNVRFFKALMIYLQNEESIIIDEHCSIIEKGYFKAISDLPAENFITKVFECTVLLVKRKPIFLQNFKLVFVRMITLNNAEALVCENILLYDKLNLLQEVYDKINSKNYILGMYLINNLNRINLRKVMENNINIDCIILSVKNAYEYFSRDNVNSLNKTLLLKSNRPEPIENILVIKDNLTHDFENIQVSTEYILKEYVFFKLRVIKNQKHVFYGDFLNENWCDFTSANYYIGLMGLILNINFKTKFSNHGKERLLKSVLNTKSSEKIRCNDESFCNFCQDLLEIKKLGYNIDQIISNLIDKLEMNCKEFGKILEEIKLNEKHVEKICERVILTREEGLKILSILEKYEYFNGLNVIKNRLLITTDCKLKKEGFESLDENVIEIDNFLEDLNMNVLNNNSKSVLTQENLYFSGKKTLNNTVKNKLNETDINYQKLNDNSNIKSQKNSINTKSVLSQNNPMIKNSVSVLENNSDNLKRKIVKSNSFENAEMPFVNTKIIDSEVPSNYINIKAKKVLPRFNSTNPSIGENNIEFDFSKSLFKKPIHKSGLIFKDKNDSILVNSIPGTLFSKKVPIAENFSDETLKNLKNSNLNSKLKLDSNFNYKAITSNLLIHNHIDDSISTLNQKYRQAESIIIDNSDLIKKEIPKEKAVFKKSFEEICSSTKINPLTEEMASNASDIELKHSSLYSEFLYTVPYKTVSKFKTPDTFKNYPEYFEFFNTLRVNEINASIVQSLAETIPYQSCQIESFKPFKIKVPEFKFGEYDLLLVCDKPKYSLKEILRFIDLNTVGTAENQCIFLAMVKDISFYPKTAVSPQVYNVEFRSKKLNSNILNSKNLFYRYVINTVTFVREHFALIALKDNSLLSLILSPKINGNQEQKDISNITTKENLKISSSEQGLITSLISLHELNHGQARAVSKSYFSKEKFVLIQGPPGTGKTTVILSIISTFLNYGNKNSPFYSPNSKFLVCTPSNGSLDEIVLRLAGGLKFFDGSIKTPNFIRIGTTSNSKVMPYTLDCISNVNCNPHTTKASKKQAINASSIVCSTLSSCVSEYIIQTNFDFLIVDEACQATELNCLIPLRYNFKKIIMIGDPKQLPPTVFSKDGLLEYSLFERLSRIYTPILLNTQYRMHQDICFLSSTIFYNGKLLTNINHSLTLQFNFNSTYFVDVSNGTEKNDQFKSFFNPCEAKIAVATVTKLKTKYKNNLEITILSPYKAQVNFIKKISNGILNYNEVNTIDAYQGKEADVIILSTVRDKGLGFICDFRRINVAITRARKSIIILGNYKCLLRSNVWAKILDIIDRRRTRFCDTSISKFFDDL